METSRLLGDVSFHADVSCFHLFFLSRDLLKCFTTAELMRWSHVKEVYESDLKKEPTATGVFEPGSDAGDKRWEDLRKRVVEHVSFCHNGFCYKNSI